MQTSVEWLWEQIRFVFTGKKSAFEVFEQAKEMHKQETKKVCEFWHGKYIPKPIFDEYYSETFKKDDKDGLYHNTSHRGYHRPDDVDKFEQDAWDNYEHVEGNLYSTTFRNAFKLGYKKAQETLYTEEQVREAIEMARSRTGYVSYEYTENEIIQSLKQPK